eukprot:gene16177-22335_t
MDTLTNDSDKGTEVLERFEDESIKKLRLHNKRIISVGSHVFVQGDLENGWGIPFIGVIKKFYFDDEDECLMCSVNWMYRYSELTAPPPRLIKFPTDMGCKGNSKDKEPNDDGKLKEIFWSSHSDDIPVVSVVHHVTIFWSSHPDDIPVASVVHPVTVLAIFWSSHSDDIPVASVIHPVTVLALRDENDSRILQQVPLHKGEGSVDVYLPGFISENSGDSKEEKLGTPVTDIAGFVVSAACASVVLDMCLRSAGEVLA